MKNDIVSSNNQIKTGAILSYLGIGINILTGLFYTPWIVKTIGQSNYGLYALTTSLISIFLLDFGLSVAVSRYVSKYIAENNQESIDNFIGIIMRLFGVIDGIIFIVLIVLYGLLDIFYANFTPGELEKFKIVYLVVAAFSVLSFPFTTLNGVLTAYEKFAALKLFEIFNKVFSVILVIIALLNGLGLYALVSMNAISGLITIILKYKYMNKYLPIKINIHVWNKPMVHEILGFSVWSTIISIAQKIPFNITTSILGAMAGTYSTAVFGIASVIEGYVYLFSSAINTMFLPRITKIVVSKNKDDDILQLMIKVGRFQFFILGLLFTGFACVGKNFIACWIGDNYNLSYYCTLVLILPSLISIPQQIADTTIVVLNKIKIQSNIYVVTAAMNLFLAFLFCKELGAIGAAIAVFITYFLRLLFMNIMYYRVLKIDIVTFLKKCYLKMLSPILLVFMIGLVLQSMIQYKGWFIVILEAGIISVLYFGFMWIMALNEKEKHLISHMFCRKKE